MDFDKCHEILGIEPGATLRQIHAAYKQLALKHHPDRAPDDPESHEIFIRVTQAYSILKNAHHKSKGSPVRPTRFKRCPRCRRFGELFPALDGGRYCVDCLLGRSRKFLPLPLVVVIRCVAVFILLAAAILLIVQACVKGSRPLFMAAGVSCLLGTAVMGIHVYSADEIKR